MRLDTNKDGKVDVAELRAGLKAMGIFRQGAAQVQQVTVAARVLTATGAGGTSRTYPRRAAPCGAVSLVPRKCEGKIK